MSTQWLCILLFLLPIMFVRAEKPERVISRVAKTGNGLVRGKKELTAAGKEYFAFRSIPYAQPPTGDLRFRAPLPILSWNDVRDARVDGPSCPQISSLGDVMGSEDCLWLSVFTPELGPNTGFVAKPIMVWIHGGRFLSGSARTDEYSPEFVMDQGDIIFVSIQYRLGALGFLSTEDSVAPGNWGLLDQQLALRWVKDNAANFGGDAGRITLVGHSSGGASTHLHMMSPGSKGLFNAVVSLSGSANRAWASRFSPKKLTARQAQLVGCNGSFSSEEVVSCLREIDTIAITQSQSDLQVMFKGTRSALPLMLFYPRVDGHFLTEEPADLLEAGNYADVSWLTGITSMEGAVYAARLLDTEDKAKVLAKDWPSALRHMAAEDFFSKETLMETSTFYFGDGAPKFENMEHRRRLAEFFSDLPYACELLRAAHLHAVRRSQPIFLYRFDYEVARKEEYLGGVAHGDDIPFLLKMRKTPNATEEDRAMIKSYTGAITEFVRSGRPSAAVSTEWPKYETDRQNYFVFGEGKIREGDILPRERWEFCKRLYNFEDHEAKDEL